MSELGLWTLGTALVFMTVHGFALLSPTKFKEITEKFPRNKWVGRLLATAAFVWSAWLVSKMPLGSFEYLKKYLFIVTPAVIGMSFLYLDELLAPRALGGLLLLCPVPIMQAAVLNPSGWSRVMSFVAYILVIKGMLLVLSPWNFRRVTARIVSSKIRCRIFGALGMAVDLLLVGLAVFVY